MKLIDLEEAVRKPSPPDFSVSDDPTGQKEAQMYVDRIKESLGLASSCININKYRNAIPSYMDDIVGAAQRISSIYQTRTVLDRVRK